VRERREEDQEEGGEILVTPAKRWRKLHWKRCKNWNAFTLLQMMAKKKKSTLAKNLFV